MRHCYPFDHYCIAVTKWNTGDHLHNHNNESKQDARQPAARWSPVPGTSGAGEPSHAR